MTNIPSIRSVSDLLAQLDAGLDPKYLCFWGHQPNKDGSIGKSCLSQWFEAAFTIDGIPYRSAEHFMMAEKARLFGDLDARSRILESRTPAEAKKLGRSIRDFDEDAWNSSRFDIVVRANAAKFGQNSNLCQFLLGTKGRILVEASPVDAIWGIGLAADDPRAEQPRQWQGLNLLGFALMAARDQL